MSGNKQQQPEIKSAPRRGRGPGAVEKPKNMKAALSRMLGYMGKLKIQLIITLVLAAISTLLVISAPQILGSITTELYDGATTGVFHWDVIVRTLVILLVVYVLGQVFAMLQNFIMAKVTSQTIYRMRRDLNVKLNKLPLAYIDKKTYGEILSRATNDIETTLLSVLLLIITIIIIREM